MKHLTIGVVSILQLLVLTLMSSHGHALSAYGELARYEQSKFFPRFRSALRHANFKEARELAASVALKTYHAGVVAKDRNLLLLATNGDVDINECLEGKTPLALAASLGYGPVIRDLLVLGANVRTTCRESDGFSSDGMNALHWAAKMDQPLSIEILLHESDILMHVIERMLEQRQTPVDMASMATFFQIYAQILEERRVDEKSQQDFGNAAEIIDIPNYQGKTALMIAAQRGNVRAAKSLLAAKAELEQQSQKGNSALALAAKNGHDEMIQLLLAHGADPHATNNAMLTPFDLAGRAAHEKLLPMLQTPNSRKQSYASPKGSPGLYPCTPSPLHLDDEKAGEFDDDAERAHTPMTSEGSEPDQDSISSLRTPSTNFGYTLKATFLRGSSDNSGSRTPLHDNWANFRPSRNSSNCGSAQNSSRNTGLQFFQ